MMKEGDTFVDTNSAMVLEDLIGQFLYGDKSQIKLKMKKQVILLNKSRVIKYNKTSNLEFLESINNVKKH
ncbi:Probable phospholipid ABC transporter-binding protein mlaD [Mannheimia haemolytica]|uniref:Probable phospholipid ABC transporter-binding protein mlaD n=1 Tax=Mannheimia haemolytica TaxID=75985 RepID=A0A378MW97_MANHA|nr:Probable phospholipid ABC transporter-binding protein mlaD [Mannheimia haemolytica]